MTARTWAKMSHEEKVATIKKGRERRLSDEQIGEECGATKGQVVGYRHRHVPGLTGKERIVPAEERKPVPEALEDPMNPQPPREETPAVKVKKSARQKAAAKATPRGILADPPNLPKLTTNDALMCTYVDANDKKRCAFRFEDPKTLRCRFHSR